MRYSLSSVLSGLDKSQRPLQERSRFSTINEMGCCMADKGLILSADPWNMTDEQTGEKLSGISVWFCNEYERGANAGTSVGFKPTKIGATPELFEVIRANAIPALYEMEYGSRPGAGGKAALTLVGLKFVGVPNIWGKPAAKVAG
jgi:hypothetical protein